jgi:hypothetical protein
MSLPIFQPGFGRKQKQPESTFTKNIILAGVSSLTYYITQLGTGDKNIIRDSLSFGVINGLIQEITPKIVKDENFQLLFIDPFFASIAQTILILLLGTDYSKNLYIMQKAIVAGVSGSALTNYLHSGIKNY